MMPSGAPRRFILAVLLAAGVLSVLLLASYRAPAGGLQSASIVPGKQSGQVDLTGHVIAPKLGNATVKAELGRAAWKVLHTTFARFPEKPTDEEKEALRSYIHLFQRLYPCGECAQHFAGVLKKYPPQVSSQSAAAMWGCMVHNVVNKRLHKPEFNCENIGDAYDCGCADDGPSGKPEMSEDAKEKLVEKGRKFDDDLLEGKRDP